MILHTFLNFLLVISLVLIFLTTHPIYTVLFLILIFCESSVILFLFNIEFLSLMLIIIYVGAIAVLFLFVVMLLNLKLMKQQIINQAIFVTLGVFALFAIIYIILKKFMLNSNPNFSNVVSNESSFTALYYDTITNLELIGQFLFNEHVFSLVLIGLILLVPLIGAVTLTQNYSKIKQSSMVLHQLSRGGKVFSVFK
jgi:NADH-quinone oxidoreductase subunit J